MRRRLRWGTGLLATTLVAAFWGASAQAPQPATVKTDLFLTLRAVEVPCPWGDLPLDEQWCGRVDEPVIMTFQELGISMALGAHDLAPLRPYWQVGLVPASPFDGKPAFLHTQVFIDAQASTYYFLAYLESGSGPDLVHFGSTKEEPR